MEEGEGRVRRRRRREDIVSSIIMYHNP